MPNKINPGEPIPFSIATNFRELGGYRTRQGRVVRRGCFYRTGALALLQEGEERTRFEALGIKAIFDFRSAQERDKLPDPSFPGAKHYPLSAMILMDGQDVNFDLDSLMRRPMEEIRQNLPPMEQFYEVLPLNNATYREMFRAICEDEVPLLFHCTAGKDRTGMAAALILRMLDVPMETVIADYLVSNHVRGSAIARVKARLADAIRRDPMVETVIDEMMSVREEYLRAAFAVIDRTYPDFESYLEGEYGIGPGKLAELRERYTEPAAD